MTDDAELLRRFAENRSETVLDELVQRHVGLVYHAAWRLCGGDGGQAREVTQAVFAELAQKIPALSGGTTLVGWLHATTCRTADARRPRGERASAASPGGAGDAARLAAGLDAALAALGDRDREALLLHFLEGRTFAEIGDAQFITEEAARVRTHQALEKLQDRLARPGPAPSAGGLAAALEQQGNRPLPPGLAAGVTAAARAPLTSVATAGSRPGATDANWLLALAAGVVALVATATAVLQWQRARALESALLTAERNLAEAYDDSHGLRTRLETERRRAQAADEDNARLIEAMDRLDDLKDEAVRPATETGATVTAEQVSARFRRAGELQRAGRFEEALREYLWCLDEGMPRFAVFAGVRAGSLLKELAELGGRYAPAREALRVRRDAAEQRMRSGPAEGGATADFAALNEALGEGARSLAEFGKLPPDDPRREVLGARVFEALATAGRYRDAAQARSYDTMRSSFELAATLLADAAVGPAGPDEAPRMQSLQHAALVRATVRDVEVLAGGGEPGRARALAAELLALDGSDATRALLQAGLARAGQPRLADGLPPPTK